MVLQLQADPFTASGLAAASSGPEDTASAAWNPPDTAVSYALTPGRLRAWAADARARALETEVARQREELAALRGRAELVDQLQIRLAALEARLPS